MQKYKGVFNWYGQTMTFWTRAKNKISAKRNFFIKISDKVKYSVDYISNYFYTERDNYTIEEVEG